MIASAPLYTFDAKNHSYAIDGVRVPSITQLIEKAGKVVAAMYYTEAHRKRGSAVHAIAADHDLGVDVGDELKVSPFRGYGLAYIAAIHALQPTWEQVEVFDVHPRYHYGGRPDRVGECFGQLTVLEIKSGCKAAHHDPQTALQALMVAHRKQVEPKAVQRLCLYVKRTGKYSIERHGGHFEKSGRWVDDPSAFDEAHDLIRRFC